MSVSTERLDEICTYLINNGELATLHKYNLSLDTLIRYKRAYDNNHGNDEGIQKILAIGDVHLLHDRINHSSYELWKNFARDFQPDMIIIGGDFADFPYLSSFDKENLRNLEGKRIKSDYDLINIELDELQVIQPNIIWLEGNHEHRMRRLTTADPRFLGMVEVPENCDLVNRGIEWVPLEEQPRKIGKLNILHGSYAGKYAANQHLDKYSHNIMFFHTHRSQRMTKNLALMDQAIASWNIGCLCGLNPDYLIGRPNDWVNQFAIMYLDSNNGNFQVYPVDIINNQILWNGKVYK